MKKSLFKGMALLSVGFAFVACSHDTISNENYVEKKRGAEYQQDFNKAFGTIASGHKWGFDQTTGRSLTRTAYSSSDELWIIPDNFAGGNQNAEGWNANDLEGDYSVSSYPQTLTGFDFSNYFLQHVEQPDGGNIKKGTQLQAYNSKTGDWEDVTGFSKGKSTTDFYLDIETTYFYSGLNRSAARTTLMADMGGVPYNNPNDENDPANGKLFRVDDGEGNYNYNYGFITPSAYHKETGEWLLKESFLAFEFPGKNKNFGPSHWIIRIGEAEKFTVPNPILAEGRVLCEDMGANDFDFNDVVFDATIMRTGEIKIKVLAHGGTLPIAIDGVDVALGQMTNTGVYVDNCQEFTIAAVNGSPKYASIDAIPVTVNPNGGAENIYNLEAPIGSAPQKVCAPVGTLWPKEYTKISDAYSPFTTWVSILDPKDWTFEMNPEKVFSFE
jgi:hypothetical protein